VSKKQVKSKAKKDKKAKKNETAKGPKAEATSSGLPVVDPAAGVERVLVITAHPDDVDFGAAGTVARMTSAGVEVTYCLVTDGDAGGSDRSSTAEQRAAGRRIEQTNAAAKVGVTELFFLGHLDGQVSVTLDLRKDLSRVIRQVRPDRVLCQSPVLNLDRIYASHPDHLAAGAAALAAVYPDARNPFAFPELLHEGFDAHTVPEVWVMAMTDPTLVVDTTEVIDQKIEALRCHASQLADPDAVDGLLRGWGQMVAEAAGLPAGRTAEAFRRVDTA
jgi:LmbE family N-acetylglucosaminyl deacetylase